MSTHNEHQPSHVLGLLASWLEEDLRELRRERDEIDARINRREERLAQLRGGSLEREAAPALTEELVASESNQITQTVASHDLDAPALIAAPVVSATEPEAAPPSAHAMRAMLPESLLQTVDAIDAQTTVLGANARALLHQKLSADGAWLSADSGFDPTNLLTQFTETVALLKRALSGRPVSVLQDIAVNLAGVSDADRVAATRYLALDGEPSETLDMIGEREGVTREHIRRRVARFRASAVEKRPLLLLCQDAMDALRQAGKPLTLHEWCAALPSWLSATRPQDLHALQTLESWQWIAANTWADIGGIVFVMAGQDQDERIRAYHDRYNDVSTLPFRLGAIRVQDLQRELGVSEASAEGLLKADGRWKAVGGSWFVRANAEQGWVGKRTIEVLNAVRSVGLEALYQSLKRVATHKFTEHGWAMPLRTVLARIAQDLRTEGVRFDIVREILSVDAPVHAAESSGTTKAILTAFGATQRALTGPELSAAIQAAGLSEASAQVALSTSPIVTRLERGIYGLTGRHADLRDISGARIRREAGNFLIPKHADSGDSLSA